ncbi:MAG: 2-dehydropantoate 2-reductase [Pseudomonadota bacterium]
MRILFLGAGALGGYFGGRMTAAGSDVTFLVRPGRAAELADGLKIRSPMGDAQIPVATIQAGDRAEPFDVIVLSNKAYALESALEAIAPYVTETTGILPLLNGVAHYDAVDAAFSNAVRLGGVAQIPANLGADGTVNHNGKLQAMIVGTRADTARARDLAEGFVAEAIAAGIDAKISTDIEQDLWNKWVFLATLAAATTLMASDVGGIMATDFGRDAVLALLDEATAVATAAGRRPVEDRMAFYRDQLTTPGSKFKASMRHDMEAGKPTEADHIIGDMIRRGRPLGVSTPLMKVALSRLQVYETARIAD